MTTLPGRPHTALLVIDDAHATEDFTRYRAPSPEQMIAPTNLYWAIQEAPGRTAGTVTTADVTLGNC